MLNAAFGVARGAPKGCGHIHNVRYEVRGQQGLLFYVVARGPVGVCAENILKPLTESVRELVGAPSPVRNETSDKMEF